MRSRAVDGDGMGSAWEGWKIEWVLRAQRKMMKRNDGVELFYAWGGSEMEDGFYVKWG